MATDRLFRLQSCLKGLPVALRVFTCKSHCLPTMWRFTAAGERAHIIPAKVMHFHSLWSYPLKLPYVSLWAKHHRWWQKQGPCALEWLSTGGQEVSAGGRKGGPCVLLGGRQIPAAPTENSVESLRKMKTRTTTWSSSLPSGYVAKGNENWISKSCLRFHAYGSIIHNGQDIGKKLNIYRQMNGQRIKKMSALTQTKGIQWPGPAVDSLVIGQVMAKILYSNHITQYWPINLYWIGSTGIIDL